MADERCEWLDKDTAERLLRGEPVGAVDDQARARAARLYAALDSAARPAMYPEIGELPGEKGALEAFRLARDESGTLGRVRLGSAAGVGTGAGAGGRLRGPVRFSIAAVVAGCALSGVAVAAGTGLLPSPFGRSEPMPASSVSGVATPSPLISESPTDDATGASPGPGTGSPADDAPDGRTAPPAGHEDDDGEHSGNTDRAEGAGKGLGTGGKGKANGKGSGKADGKDKWAPAGGNNHTSGDVYRRLAAACRDYRAGHVDSERRRRLESEARGAEKVAKFCDRLLGPGRGPDHPISYVPAPPLSSASPAPSPSPSVSLPVTPQPGDGGGGKASAGSSDS
ncbi:hypothetical protein [Streptomyces sp. A 4/2]|uniref:hypothetical protein n=1 Tax=Streptomyces sp. A 4/2 TaxID=2934314 RepID=UPI00202403CA|nr:hypothetical protein [Streptomyces sp. A 4/2]